MPIYICMHAYICACLYTHIHVNRRVCVYIKISDIHIYTYTYVCMYVCMHACMHACMYVCVDMFIYVRQTQPLIEVRLNTRIPQEHV